MKWGVNMEEEQHTEETDISELIIEDYHGKGQEEKLNDVIITQCIICLMIALAFVVINIFYSKAAEIIFDRFLRLTSMSIKESINDIIIQIKNAV